MADYTPLGVKLEAQGEAAFKAQIKSVSQQVNALGAEMKKIAGEFKGNETSMEALRAKHKVLKEAVTVSQKQTELFAKRLEQEQEELVKLARELEAVTKDEKANKEAVEAAQKKYLEQEAAVSKAESALSRAETTLARNKKELSANEKAMKNFGKETKDAGKSMDDAGKSAISFADILKANLISDAIMDGVHALADAFKQISNAASGFLKDAVSTGSEFDHTMSGVAAISGATGEAFQKLREEAIKMGGSTKFSANEAAEALNYMAMAGWDDNDMLGGLKGVMDLAAASGADLARTSDIVTDAMTAFGLSADGMTRILQDGVAKEIPNVTHFADVLAQVSAKANTNVDMLGESFKYVAPTAGALGYAIEDVAVALGLMANQGIKESRAGTALNTLLTNMSKPTKDMQSAMDILGVSLDDGAGNMLSFMSVMERLRAGFNQIQMPLDEFQSRMAILDSDFANGVYTQKEYDDAVKELMNRAYGAEGALKAEAAAMLSGKEGMAGLLAIVNSSDEDFYKLTKAISEASYEIDGFSGAAERMAHIAEDNLQGDITSFNSAMETLKIRIADELTPTLRTFTQFGVASIREITEAFEEDGLSGAIDTLGLRVAEGITGLAERVPDLIEIGGKFVGAIAEGFSNNLPRIQSAFGGVLTEFRENLPDMASFGGEMLSNIANGVLDGLPEIADAANQLMDDFGGYLRDNLPELLKQGLRFVLELSGSIRENAGKIIDGAIALAKNLAKGLADSIPTIVENIPTIVSNIAGVINDNAPKILMAGIEIIITLVKGIIQSIPVIIREMPKIIRAVWDTITAFNWLNLGRQIMTGFKNGVTGMINDIKNAGKQIAEAIQSNIKNLPEVLKNIGKNIISGFWNGIQSKIQWLRDNVKNFINGIMNLFTGPSGFDTHSPSKWSEGVTDNVMIGAGKGFIKGLPDLKSTAKRTVSQVQNALNFGGTIGAYSVANNPANLGNGNPAKNLNGADASLDPDVLAQAIKRALSGVGVYASGQRIGTIVERVKANNQRAAGYLLT